MTTPKDDIPPHEAPSDPGPIVDPMVTGGADPRDALFDTEALRGELKKRSSRGGGLTIVAQAVQFISSVASMMYLGRVLSPADFGVIAMAYSVILPVMEIRGFGIPQAMVQRKSMNAAEGRSLFYYNMRLQFAVFLIVALLAWPAAWFYGDERVFSLLLVFNVILVSMGLSILHHGLLRRQMRFGMAAGIELGADLFGIVVACVAAALGAGYWSLVWLHVGSQTVRAVGFWVATGWLPGLPKRDKTMGVDVKDMRQYSWSVTGSKAIEQLIAKLDQVLIGRFAGDVALGYYNRAFNWSIMPVRQLYFPLQQVVVSGSSRLLDEPERFRNYMCRGWSATHTLVIPMMLWLVVASGDFIRVLLGPQWDASVPIFRLLVIGGLMGSTVYLTRWLYLAEGTTGRQLKWTAWSAPVLVAGVVAGLIVGVVAFEDDGERTIRAYCVAFGFMAATSLMAIPRVLNATRDSRVSAGDYWGTAWRPLAASLAATLPSGYLQFIAMTETIFYWRIPAVLGVFGVVYLAVFTLLPGGRQSVKDLLHIFRSMK